MVYLVRSSNSFYISLYIRSGVPSDVRKTYPDLNHNFSISNAVRRVRFKKIKYLLFLHDVRTIIIQTAI